MMRKRKKSKPLSLQLTSLLDMFTIILVFLMVGFQAEDKDFVLNSELKLPTSSAQSKFKTAVNVAITEEVIVVEGHDIYKLRPGGKLQSKDMDAPKLEKVVEAVELAWDFAKREADEEYVVVIQAHKSLPYKTINMVMRSAAHAGFFKYRLVVAKE